MKTRIKVGDQFVISGHSFFESSKVVSVDKKTGISILENNIKLNKDGLPINSKFEVEPYDETYETRRALFVIPGKIRKLNDKLENLNKGNCLKIDKYLSKILEKLG